MYNSNSPNRSEYDVYPYENEPANQDRSRHLPTTSDYQTFSNELNSPAKTVRRVPRKAADPSSPIRKRYRETEEFKFNSSLIDKIYKYVYIFNDNFLSHPFVRLRKVIQLDRSTDPISYHLTPLTVVPIVFRIQSKYGLSGLYQGLTSVLITKGIIVVVESRLSEALDLNCINYDTPTEQAVFEEFQFKTFTNQILLKMIVFCVTTPFLCISTIDVVQSNLGFKNPGILDFLNDSFARTFSLSGHRTLRLVPIYLLIPPTICYHSLHFICVTTIAQLTNFAIRSLRSKHDVQKNRRNKVYNEIMCLITANLIASTLFYPIETILNRLYVQGTRTLIDNLNSEIVIKPVLSNYEGFFDCKKAILQNETNLGFYKGFGSLVLQFSLQFLIMKITKTIIKNYF